MPTILCMRKTKVAAQLKSSMILLIIFIAWLGMHVQHANSYCYPRYLYLKFKFSLRFPQNIQKLRSMVELSVLVRCFSNDYFFLMGVVLVWSQR